MNSYNQIPDDFRGSYQLRSPRIKKNSKNKNQYVGLNENDGLKTLQPAPATNVTPGTPPKSSSDNGTNTHLWVITERGVLYIPEVRIKRIRYALPKHSNLTGGGEAYLGGEMWFESDTTLWINGWSGRYPPKNAAQLKEAVRVFESFGYRVHSLGWNEKDGEKGKARRFLDTS